MSRKRFTMEQIISLLREVDVKVSQGKNVGQIFREIGIKEQTYYRWRKECLSNLLYLFGWETRIRTWIYGVRVRCPTIERSPSILP